MTMTSSQVQTGMQQHQDERQTTQEPTSRINVGSTERQLSTLGGGALVLLGLRQRSLGGLLLAGIGGALIHRGVTGSCKLYSAIGVDTAHGGEGAAPEQYFSRGIHVEQSFSINKPRQELYDFWRKLENLPQIFRHIESVQVLDDRKSRWVCKGPFGMEYEWDAEIINDEPGSLIAWRSLGGADVDNAGSVRFIDAPADRGTELKVVIDYIPTGGQVGKTIAQLLGQNPESQIREDLRRFKRIQEAGEELTTQGQPRGTCLSGGAGR